MPRQELQRNEMLPLSMLPFGVGRLQAASLIGVSASTFDKAVAAGTMPQPRVLGGRLLWDVREIRDAFEELPHREGSDERDEFETSKSRNPWDDA